MRVHPSLGLFVSGRFFNFVAEGGEYDMKEQTLQKKQAVVDEIKEAIQKAKSVTIVSYNGISVEGNTTAKVPGAVDAQYKVYKNTWFVVPSTNWAWKI